MSSPAENCASVHARESAFLDGRLAASVRRSVQQHLQACPACLRRLQQIARLSRATHNLPLHRAAGALAQDVRRRVAERRQTTVAGLSAPSALRVWQLAAAAVLLLALGWLAGYGSGRGMLAGSPNPGGDGIAAAVRSATWIDRADPTFVAVGEELVRDLELTPALPERSRRPMIAAELALFDLEPRARQVLASAPIDSGEHRLARFVTELADSMAEHDPDWQSWQQRARRDGLLSRRASRGPARQPAVVSIEVVVEHHGDGLSSSERAALAEFLALRQEQVAGGLQASVALADRWQGEREEGTPFALVSGMAGARSLATAGMHESAERMLAALQRQLELATGGVRLEAGAGEPSGNPAAELLEQMMRELGVERRRGNR